MLSRQIASHFFDAADYAAFAIAFDRFSRSADAADYYAARFQLHAELTPRH
jgi:hypothetical protein